LSAHGDPNGGRHGESISSNRKTAQQSLRAAAEDLTGEIATLNTLAGENGDDGTCRLKHAENTTAESSKTLDFWPLSEFLVGTGSVDIDSIHYRRAEDKKTRSQVGVQATAISPGQWAEVKLEK
jgi:hypothetical protein